MPDECSRVENNCGGGFSINAAVNQPLRFPGSVQTCKQNSSRRRTGAGGLEVLVQHAVKCHIHPALHLRAGWIWHFTESAAVRFNCRMKALWSAAVLLRSHVNITLSVCGEQRLGQCFRNDHRAGSTVLLRTENVHTWPKRHDARSIIPAVCRRGDDAPDTASHESLTGSLVKPTCQMRSWRDQELPWAPVPD